MTEPTPDPTIPKFVEVVAKQIRVEAAAAGVNQATIATAVGIGQPGFSRRMNGDIGWAFAELLAVARYFRVPLSTITPDSLTEDVLS